MSKILKMIFFEFLIIYDKTNLFFEIYENFRNMQTFKNKLEKLKPNRNIKNKNE